MGLIEGIFNRNDKKLDDEIKKTSSTKVLNRLKSADGDLKVKHLLAVFEGTVKADGKEFTFHRLAEPIGTGAYGQIFCAWDDTHEQYLALKAPLSAVPENDRSRDPSSFRNPVEVEMHLRAFKSQIAGENYVVPTGSVTLTSDNRLVQPMSLALCSGEKPLVALSKPSHEFPTQALTLLTARDWLMSMAQIQSADMAHRDVKPENWLLSRNGVWQLSDFGTAGDVGHEFVVPKSKAYRTTGNGTVLNKSPEWLRMEAFGNVELVGKKYCVGKEDDVFALGIAVFRLLTGGGMPFLTPANAGGLEGAYEEDVLAYAESGLSFSDWHRQNGQWEFPPDWQNFLDQALEPDPQKRATVEDLLKLPIFNQLSHWSVEDLRQQLVMLVKSQ